MNRTKKVFSFLIAVIFLFSLVTPAPAATVPKIEKTKIYAAVTPQATIDRYQSFEPAAAGRSSPKDYGLQAVRIGDKNKFTRTRSAKTEPIFYDLPPEIIFDYRGFTNHLPRASPING